MPNLFAIIIAICFVFVERIKQDILMLIKRGLNNG